MKKPINAPYVTKDHCLNEDDFYGYVTHNLGTRDPAELESHLSVCPRCSSELGELIKIIYPEPSESAESTGEVSKQEIDETLARIGQISWTERNRQGRSVFSGAWYRWGAVAAAVVAAVVSGSLASVYFWNWTKAEAFSAQARAALEEAYAPQSPSGLRLNLPFQPSANRRGSPGEDSLETAEKLFYQALAFQQNMLEPRLGLGSVYLAKSEFSKASAEFDRILAEKGTHQQALLGRGVALYEAGLASLDPVERTSKIDRALKDFEAVLRENPGSDEARFDRAHALYDSGRHNEALAEIDLYLSRDSTSIWAEKLRAIQARIRMTRADAVQKEVNRAAMTLDAAGLERLVRLVPYQIPNAIRNSLKRSLQIEGTTPEGKRGSPDLGWASGILTAEYGFVTGDRTYQRLLDFYAGLSPPRRQAKKALDARLQKLIDTHRHEDIQSKDLHSALLDSQFLEKRFGSLRDHWQLVDLHHLRGNWRYYSKADFPSALAEYQKMLRAAELSGSPDLIAKALGAVASAHLDKRDFEKAIPCLVRMKELSAMYGLQFWGAYASNGLGTAYMDLNKLDQSLDEFTQALAAGYRLMDEETVVESLESIGAIMERKDRLPEARAFYQESMTRQESFIKEGTMQAAPALRARWLNRLWKLGDLALRMNDLADAENRFRESLASSGSGMRELEARNRIGLAQVYMRRKQFEEAGEELRVCRSITSSGEFPELDWQTHSLTGDLRRREGNSADALLHYEHAIQVLEEMRKHVARNLRQSFLIRRFDPYQGLVSVLIRSQKDPRAALAWVDRAKSMTLKEQLGAQEGLSRAALVRPAVSKSGPEFTLPESNTFIVEYFSTTEELFVFGTGRHGVKAAAVALSAAELNWQVQQYLESIQENGKARFEALARKLYDYLIAPVAAQLESQTVEHLVILPDGPLHSLPFAGLKSPAGSYLLEKHALAYAPSRSILNYCLSKKREISSGRRASVLLLDGTSNLAGASEEIAHLSRLYGLGAHLVDGRDLDRLAQAAADAEIIHFSGHALPVEGRPSLVFKSPRGETYLRPTQIEDLRLARSFLVNLAGCSTGVGPRSDGETPWSLLPAFLNAGAPTVLVSLLPVDDAATRALNMRFYEFMARGAISKARALQMAQLYILKGNLSKSDPPPLHWTPFVLVGDPQ
jgi:CHAT domain-containing protein